MYTKNFDAKVGLTEISVHDMIGLKNISSGADPGISKRGRGARSRRGRILRAKVCFYAPSHIPYVFVRRIVNNIHIVNTAC